MNFSQAKKLWDYPWEKYALFLFIFTLPFSLRNVLLDSSPTGVFNEYTDISFYLSDITLLILFLLTLLKNKYYGKSSIMEMFHVEHFLLFLPFIFWSLASSFWAESVPLAFYTALKIFEGFLLFLLLLAKDGTPLFHVEHFWAIGEREKCSTWNIREVLFVSFIISGFFQAMIGIFQFFIQGSLGLHWLGESQIAPDIAGVAKVVIGEEILVRAYGLFPHPNVLGGFLGITLLFILIYPHVIHRKMFHVEHFYLKTAFGIIFFALLCTFSKSAILGFSAGLVWILYQQKNVPRGTRFLERLKLFHVEQKVTLGVVILLIIGVFLWINPYFWLFQSFQERIFSYLSLLSLGLPDAIYGLGSGQYVWSMGHLSSQFLEAWQYQPPHNLFLLILGENGLIGLLLFLIPFAHLVYFYRKLFHVEQKTKIVPRGTRRISILFLSLFIMLFVPAMTDHYLWDIQQGQLLFWLIFGLIFRELTEHYNIT